MSQSTSKKIEHRGRIFPELSLPPEELARRKAEQEERFVRCKAIFERVRPELIEEHYGWYMAIEPVSEDYCIDADQEVARQKARQKYPDIVTCMFCLNETGACGRI